MTDDTRTKPVLLTTRDLSERMIGRLQAAWRVIYIEDLDDPDPGLDDHGDQVTGLLPPGHMRIDGALMDRLPNLKVISTYGVGYDAIDAAAAAARGIFVAHTPGVLNDEVANTTILLVLAVYRDVINQDAYLRSGQWAADGPAPLTRSIAGSTVGFLGMGRIGQAIAEKLGVFGVDILYHTRSPKDVPFDYCPDLVNMATRSDVLIVITPGGAATDKLVNKNVLDALGPRGTLINIARGSVVDEAALIDALTEGRLGAAGLDVFADEPNVPPALVAMKNVVLLPHVGSATQATRQAMGDLACDNLDVWLTTGRPLRPVPECLDLQGRLPVPPLAKT